MKYINISYMYMNHIEHSEVIILSKRKSTSF